MPNNKEELAKLGAVPLFEDLTKRELSRLYRESKIVNHGEGHTIVVEGRGGHGFHLIRSGTARVLRNGRLLARLGPGKFFGELSLFDSGPRTATIVSETPLEVLVVSRADFRRLVQGNPTLAWKLLAHLACRLREEQSARDAALG